MATADPTQQRLMRERARALALVLLTRRDGTTIREAEEDTALPLTVTLSPTDKPGVRQFGVTLRYVFEPVTADHANKVLRPTWPVPGSGPFPFPVVLFFFTMKDDGAWYCWVAEPIVTADGKAQLPLRANPDCQPLTADSMEEVLDRIDSWYDAHYEGLSAALPTGKHGKKS
jgi:hypothetical protein